MMRTAFAFALVLLLAGCTRATAPEPLPVLVPCDAGLICIPV